LHRAINHYIILYYKNNDQMRLIITEKARYLQP
jgi:hypothetical protein